MPDCETLSSCSLFRSHLFMWFGTFKGGVFGSHMFLWKPWELSQSRSGSLHTSFCRSKVFTSISEGVQAIWRRPCPCQSPREWQRVFVPFVALGGLADVAKCGRDSLSSCDFLFWTHRFQRAFHSRLFCLDSFRAKQVQTDPLLHYLPPSHIWGVVLLLNNSYYDDIMITLVNQLCSTCHLSLNALICLLLTHSFIKAEFLQRQKESNPG